MDIRFAFYSVLLRCIALAALCLTAAACTTSTIRSEVTAFHKWPENFPDKTFLFERSREQENNLEHAYFENLVRAELLRLGFADAANASSARLKVAVQTAISVRDVRIVEPVIVDPWYGPPYYSAYYGSHYWPRWGPYGYYSPFYDPFWYGPAAVVQQERQFQLFTRQLKIIMTQAADDKRLYEVTVVSEGSNGALAAVMPYLVKSAFADFPGASGVPRQIDLKMQE